jgi:hypothetical protein
MENRNRVPSPEGNRPRLPPAAARPLPGTGPPGGLGPPPHPQHRRDRRCPRRRRSRNQPRAHLVQRRPGARPRPRRRRRPLPPLRAPSRHRRRPAQRLERRHPRPAPPPRRTPANIRPDRRRATHQANRGSHVHHRDHEVESPAMGHNSSGAERLVAGDDDAGGLVAGGDELEEQAGGLGLEGDVADLVDLCGHPHRSTYADTGTMRSTSEVISTSFTGCICARIG